jgi:hypothetical protein
LILIFAYVMLALLPIAAVAYIVWDHRRKIAQREAVSTGRMEELLGVAMHAARTEPAEAHAPVSEERIEPSSTPAATFVLRERFLSPPQTLLYYLLKTGVPEYLVTAQVPIGSLLEPAPHLAAYAREEQARMFARHVVDFVILDKSTRPFAVVNLVSAAEGLRASATQMKAWLATAGLRYVELDAAALPRKDAVRALVLGENSVAATGAAEADVSR